MPRRFTPAGVEARPRANVPLVRILDTLVVGSRHLADREWVVGLDALGELVATPLDEAELMTGACRDLAHALAAAPPTWLDFDSLDVMTVETVETTSSRGDAVYMYRRLRGPIPPRDFEQRVG